MLNNSRCAILFEKAVKRSNIRPLLRNGLATKHHEIWRDDNNDDVKVTRRDGVTTASIEKNRGFINYSRIPEPYRDPLERVFDWKEINYSVAQHDEVQQKIQAARCMDCGTPFCQTHTGCPVNNLIPEWNELVYEVIEYLNILYLLIMCA